jgi:hypothetical protein
MGSAAKRGFGMQQLGVQSPLPLYDEARAHGPNLFNTPNLVWGCMKSIHCYRNVTLWNSVDLPHRHKKSSLKM